MNYRIEISPLPQWHDARGVNTAKQMKSVLKLDGVKVLTRDVYTLSADVSEAEAQKIASLLYNPVLQCWSIGSAKSENYQPMAASDYVAVIGYKPGVTDNVGRSARFAIGDILGRKLRENEQLFTSVEYLLYGKMTRQDAENVAHRILANELIQSIRVLSREEAAAGIPMNLPFVTAKDEVRVRKYDLEVSDHDLEELSRKGILALSLEEMKSIQNYFRHAQNRASVGLDANPTDVEMEVIAQTWSEHCKHKIFSALIDYENPESGECFTVDSCYKSFVRKSTREIGEKIDWLVSVFVDNAGVIKFNDKVDLVYKVETHNSPSALDPYGGSMTGIVGVNRDPLGTGQGADLLINVWGYCLGSPFTEDKDVPEGLLHPRRLRDGVHKGVIDGGNQSGIPYGCGWEYFDERYLGKPLVYCGTVGTLPKEVHGIKGSEKTIKPGDLIVMGGGRIGKDGIHGATFSSEELHKDSPVQAVQIGDPITQKKLGDFIREARDRGLYRFITDNGAGGLSSSVGEMAELCNGCRMDLAKAPLKYAGLQPWEILVSEAQERMSFAVPPENMEEFRKLAEARDVEISVLGEFTDDGKFHMLYNGKTVAWLDIEFMHEGLPRKHLKARWQTPKFPEVNYAGRDLSADWKNMMARLNVCSDEFKARQYDHEVKGLSVIKPFVGKKRDVASDATVTMIEPNATEGVILAAAILPRHADLDTYWATASSFELAIRKVISVGGQLGEIAALDNFCWPDPVKSEKTPDGEYKLAQLVRANQALYTFSKKFLVPCISGKDSMKNDSTRGGRKISIPPSLLISVISKMDDITKAVTLDAKKAGDYVYVIGKTRNELGGSEYFNMLGGHGNTVPKVDADESIAVCKAVAAATAKELVNSLATPSLGGLAVAFAKTAMGGCLGLEIDPAKIPAENCDMFALLFSESNGRFVATVAPEKAAAFEAALNGTVFARVGKVTAEEELRFGSDCVVKVEDLRHNYQETLDQI